MSTYEYHDLYLKCQKTGKYHMFVFDMKKSQQMSIEKRRIAQDEMITLMLRLYSEIKNIEKQTNKKILVFEEDFFTYESGRYNPGFGMKKEPFIFGDSFGFTVYRGTITADEIYFLYYQIKEELNIDFDFHLSNGYYEINDYSEGNTKYFRGYCLDVLSTLHKKEKQKELNKVKKKLKQTCNESI